MDSQLSKSEKKRRAKGIEQLVIELAALPQSEIAGLPCDQEIRHEMASVKSLKGGARKRQLKYVTKLLRDRPVEQLYDFLARKKGSILKEKREFHELEHFRNLLLNEAVQLLDESRNAEGYANGLKAGLLLQDSKTIRDIARQLPGVDQTRLRNAAIQFARTRNRKFSRELFRIMRAALEKAQFPQTQDKSDGI